MLCFSSVPHRTKEITHFSIHNTVSEFLYFQGGFSIGGTFVRRRDASNVFF